MPYQGINTGPYQGVHQGFQPLSFVGISKHCFPEQAPVQLAIRIDNGGAKVANYVLQSGRPRGNHLAAHLVSINYVNAERLEGLCDSTLARPDSAGKPYNEWQFVVRHWSGHEREKQAAQAVASQQGNHAGTGQIGAKGDRDVFIAALDHNHADAYYRPNQ